MVLQAVPPVDISIHALRKESDLPQFFEDSCNLRDFNPRSP